MEHQLINGEVIITDKISLQEFIDRKNSELEMINIEITNAQLRQQEILTELENLLK